METIHFVRMPKVKYGRLYPLLTDFIVPEPRCWDCASLHPSLRQSTFSGYARGLIKSAMIPRGLRANPFAVSPNCSIDPITAPYSHNACAHPSGRSIATGSSAVAHCYALICTKLRCRQQYIGVFNGDFTQHQRATGRFETALLPIAYSRYRCTDECGKLGLR